MAGKSDQNGKNKNVQTDLLRDLANLLKETDLSEIEIEQEGVRMRVARQITGVTTVAAAAPPPQVAPVPAAAPEAPAIAATASGEADHPGAVRSPMVGTAYVAPEPGADPFVQVGSMVSEGQTVLIVEAMKTMNPIPAPRAGKVTQILIQNAQPVEFDQPLLVIE